jgi:hypothetical protein
MAGTTPRFGFNFFGAGTPGTITDNGQKYTSLDRLLLDRLLASVETHHHRYVPPTSGLATAPTTTLITTGGQLSAGYTYYYKVAVVDLEGNESIASPEAAQGTPTPLQPPAMPGLSSMPEESAGVLTPGYYYYALTALRGTEESVIGPAAMVNLVVGETAVLLDLPTYGAAHSFRVWRMGSQDAGFTRIGIVDTPGDIFVDDGSTPADPCACDPGVAPPAFNTGISNYAIDVELPVSVDVTKIRSWKIYRSNYAGIYGAGSLVHEVVERTDEWDMTSPLVTVWTDTGLGLQVGQPLNSDKNMRFQPFIFDHVSEEGDPLPDPAAYPEFYPFIYEGKLYAKIGTDWTLVGGGGGGGGMSPILTNINGDRFMLSVDATGALVTTQTYFPGPPAPPINFVEV